ncbi:MAG: penicillin-binding protein 1C [Saprospiraceae bacterium]|nr:penicillin-binding protein 1C [Saprospiraceae bacterium]
MNLRRFLKSKAFWAISIFLVLLIVYLFSLPRPLFKTPLSYVLESSDGTLLGAKIATDGQWRFPSDGEIPEKYLKALLTFEDKHFYYHLGVNPVALIRAMYSNLKAGRTVSGASTLTMQVVALSRGYKSGNIFEKFTEMLLASRIELSYNKQEILDLYASNAPFGGNVVGLEAACWRYFGKDEHLLSWAEAATLAVLPNSPALIHPGRNRERLLKKRNRLLQNLLENKTLDSTDYVLALDEPLPPKPFDLPRLAPHLLETAKQESDKNEDKDYRIISTIDPALQTQLMELASYKSRILQETKINNIAILIASIPDGEILAYVGNAPGTGAINSEDVDIIQAPRSTGSILKPFLYNWMVGQGELMPDELIPDVPTTLGGFRPENFHKSFDGAVPASGALVRSLNIPFALLLQRYGVERFLYQLQRLNLRHMNQSSGHYGLSLILGGAECSLWDYSQAYGEMCLSALDQKKNYHLHYRKDKKNSEKYVPHFNPGASWITVNQLQELERPNKWGEWQRFGSSKKIAWKTGTSHGLRDAWAIGVTPSHLVAIWVGNASGEGRPGIIGVEAAAPLLFTVFDMLPAAAEWKKPSRHLKTIKVCRISGHLAKDICPEKTTDIPANAHLMTLCPHHHLIGIDAMGKRAYQDCAETSVQMKSWFVLPPVQEYYYKNKNADYQSLPGWTESCAEKIHLDRVMQFIYPQRNTIITIPKTWRGETNKTVLKIAHKKPATRVFWFLDDALIGVTSEFHELEIAPSPGMYRLSATDELGNTIEQKLEVKYE